MSYKRYWVALAIVIIGSFAVLGGVGRKMISEAPPFRCVFGGRAASLYRKYHHDGQGVWQSIGGQEIGTVWATALMSPQTGARIGCTGIRNSAQHLGAPSWCSKLRYSQSRSAGRPEGSPDSRDSHQYYDASRNRVILSADRATAFEQLRAYYTDVFATGRSEYAILTVH